jgi:hypothetical protein
MVAAAHTSAAQPLASGAPENEMIKQRVALATHPDAPPAANPSIALLALAGASAWNAPMASLSRPDAALARTLVSERARRAKCCGKR